MKPEQAAALRAPFPPEQIGKLPKGGVQLDYVGHAATTDRLLQIDPEWGWEPLALEAPGVPALDVEGNLWIRLTVCGVTRLGVGDGPNMKVRIGDAIRNAAMRFGVALDLWAKEDLQPSENGASGDPVVPRTGWVPAQEQFQAPPGATDPPDPELVKARQSMWAEYHKVVDARVEGGMDKGIAEADLKTHILASSGVSSTKELSIAELKAVTAGLKLMVA